MSREIKYDGDLRFETFASYPNSTAFEPNTALTSAKNVRMSAGVITPRKGCSLIYTAGSSVTYAVAAHGKTGDSILLFGPNVRVNCDTGTATPASALSAKRPVRGQGYADALCMESTDTTFVAGGNVIERLVTAKDDQLRYTLYGGVEPNDPDTVSLVQCTYDPIQAVSITAQNVMAFGKRSIYAVKSGLGYVGAANKQEALHQVVKISSSDGVSGPDAVASTGGVTAFFDINGGPSIKIIAGDKFQEGNDFSSTIKDLMLQVDPAKYAQVSAVACGKRIYFALPLTQGNKWVVLVLNTENKGLFESIDEYPFDPDILLVARRNGIPRVWALNKQHKRLYLLDEGTHDYNNNHIVAEVVSRDYAFRTMSDKRYDGFYVDLQEMNGAHVDIHAITVNPDSDQLLDTIVDAGGSTVRRGLINKRAMGLKLKVIVRQGAPKILGMGVDGSLAGRSLFGII